jgi:hypothetical protein
VPDISPPFCPSASRTLAIEVSPIGLLNDQDDGALEARVAHFGGGDKQLAGQGGRSRRFVRLRRQGCLEQGRLQQERHDQAETA